ncbi:radial spoke head protein, putative [Ichthyophthirius multifiliis]|uniref:Radial spoke head protein, putative n=1 Tax=Ichthyophthirius multifiliis TaxID=5932 RepID=G0R0I6_ICHMU|nr:radial spoke head protein, putative [Ichthyophthirius multifiliis]EGR29011.1 radial spoke head protein, putative [Ichthyophthirius multifiliis]|eukprot:XP_004030247.1 radial spoke head protein, putative [Ichthyophthirius multifiliis]
MNYNQFEDKLKNIKKKDGKTNLYEHFSNLMTKVLLDNPKENIYDKLEDYSQQIRELNFNFENQENSNRLREQYKELTENYKNDKKLLSVIQNIFVKFIYIFIQRIMEGGGEENQIQEPAGSLPFVPNFVQQSKWFFNKIDKKINLIQQLKLLSYQKKDKNIKNLRFWGKILGQKKDYYITEGQADFEDQGEIPPEVEPLGGEEPSVNQYNYWVTTDLNDKWVELPYVTSNQIQLSRKFKYLFTGDLNKQVIVNPHFESNKKSQNKFQYSSGTEKELLKCIIVRINHCISVQPKGLKIIDENDETRRTLVDPEEGTFKFPNFNALTQIENWVHSKPNILNEGRLKHTIPEAEENQDQEELAKKIMQKDPFEPLIKPLNLDKPPQGYESAWAIRSYGDLFNYRQLSRENESQNYGYLAIKNLVWPGSVTIYHNKKWFTFYVGQGIKQQYQLYFPCEPEKIQNEVEFRPTQIEQIVEKKKDNEQIKDNNDE